MSLQIGDPYISRGEPFTIAAVYAGYVILDNGRIQWTS